VSRTQLILKYEPHRTALGVRDFAALSVETIRNVVAQRIAIYLDLPQDIQTIVIIVGGAVPVSQYQIHVHAGEKATKN
jgi:hypothetical protein